MNNLSSVLSSLAYLALQVLFIRHWALFDMAFCLVYISVMLLLPFQLSSLWLMAVGFVLGFCVDIFYDTLGIHAACCVFLGYLRPYIANLIRPSGGYEIAMKPYLSIMGLRWFVTYTALLTAVHHFPLFLIEAWSFHLFGFTLLKALFSTLFTSVVIVIFQYLFYRNK
ncbi:MAG: Rod shape-determining protein MreD [Cytophagales bacterium]|nr:MAG: Rod shape-determining protein MreD [Cytophagales bacterium]